MSDDSSLLGKFCTRTTCHGPLDFYRTTRIHKFFWAVVTVGAFATIGYYSYLLVDQYNRGAGVTQIVQYDVDRMQFPNVTICNPAMFNYSYMMENVRVPAEIQSGSNSTQEQLRRDFMRYLRFMAYSTDAFGVETETGVKDAAAYYQLRFNLTVNPNAQSIKEFLSNATFQCDRLLFQCTFGGVPFDCCENARKPFMDTGYCYTINMGAVTNQSSAQTVSGFKSGFDFTIRMNAMDIGFVGQFQPVGVRLHLTDYATALDPNPVAIPHSVHAAVQLKATHYVLSPNSDFCTYDRPLLRHESYTQTLCELECYEDLVMEVCGCVPLSSFSEPDDQQICTPSQMLTCVFPYLSSATNDSKTFKSRLVDAYQENCPKLCEYWTYDPYLVFTSRGQANTTILNGNVRAMPSTMTTTVSIYFGSLTYEEYQEQPLMDVNTLVSNLGGILGLYSGFSVLTIVQFFMILIFGPCEDGGGCCDGGDKKNESQVQDLKGPVPKAQVEDTQSPGQHAVVATPEKICTKF